MNALNILQLHAVRYFFIRHSLFVVFAVLNTQNSNYLHLLTFLVSTHFMIHVYTQLVPAILPTVKTELGITFFEASLLLSVPMIVQVLTYIPVGIISDRVGTELIMISFLVTATGAYMIASSNSLWFLMLGSGMLTFGSTIYHPPSLKASSMVEPSKMNLAMGAHLAGGSSGFAAGPFALGFLMPRYGWRFSFYIWIPVTLVISLLSYLYLKRQDSENEKDKGKKARAGFQSLFTTSFILIVAAGALMEIAIINLSSFIPTYFQTILGVSESLSSFVFGLGSLVGIVGAFLGGVQGNILGIYKATTVNLVLMTLAIAVVPFITGAIMIMVIYVFFESIFTAIMPSLNAMIAENSEMENRSLAFSVFFMTANILGAFAPILTSILAETYTLRVVFPMSVAILTPAIVLVFYLYKKNIQH